MLIIRCFINILMLGDEKFSEKLCEMYKDKMSILIIRSGNIYEFNDKFDPIRSKVIPALIRKFEENKIIEI